MNDLAALLAGRTWALERSALDRLSARLRATPTINLPMEAALARRPASARREDVAVVPLVGFLLWRPDPFETAFLGAVSVVDFIGALNAAAAAKSVAAIILDVESPGGSVDGIPEAAEAVRRVARTKPVTSVANTMMASAAYWIGAQAGQVIASPSALVGSIGVYGTHVSETRALDKAGFDVTIISAGKYKAEGHPAKPLDDTARGHFQELVDSSYDLFVEDVARGRGTTLDAVRTGYGQGRALDARAARTAKLVDRIATLEAVITGSQASERERFAFEAERRAARGLREPTFEMERRQRLAMYERERRERDARQATGGTR